MDIEVMNQRVAETIEHLNGTEAALSAFAKPEHPNDADAALSALMRIGNIYEHLKHQRLELARLALATGASARAVAKHGRISQDKARQLLDEVTTTP